MGPRLVWKGRGRTSTPRVAAYVRACVCARAGGTQNREHVRRRKEGRKDGRKEGRKEGRNEGREDVEDEGLEIFTGDHS